jgi:hydrogenase/urease accessory protein HupE
MKDFARPLALMLACLCGAGHAHESLPASLLISEQPDHVFDVSWRVPATQGMGVPRIEPVFPPGCRMLGAATQVPAPAASRSTWRLRCADGLGDARIQFQGLPATLINVLVRIGGADGGSRTYVAAPRTPFVVTGGSGPLGLAVSDYFLLGVGHILTGADHLLFVLCLLLLVRDRWRLLQAITAFTLAHSVTLALAALGLVHVPSAPVEATIALSILFLARQLARPQPDGMAARAPWLVAFAFGLLHGLGFAGALAEVGLPQADIPLALLLFNLGVEAGQVLFVASMLLALAMLARLRRGWPSWSRPMQAYAVGSVSAFWLLQRLSWVVQ